MNLEIFIFLWDVEFGGIFFVIFGKVLTENTPGYLNAVQIPKGYVTHLN